MHLGFGIHHGCSLSAAGVSRRNSHLPTHPHFIPLLQQRPPEPSGVGGSRPARPANAGAARDPSLPSKELALATAPAAGDCGEEEEDRLLLPQGGIDNSSSPSAADKVEDGLLLPKGVLCNSSSATTNKDGIICSSRGALPTSSEANAVPSPEDGVVEAPLTKSSHLHHGPPPPLTLPSVGSGLLRICPQAHCLDADADAHLVHGPPPPLTLPLPSAAASVGTSGLLSPPSTSAHIPEHIAPMLPPMPTSSAVAPFAAAAAAALALLGHLDGTTASTPGAGPTTSAPLGGAGPSAPSVSSFYAAAPTAAGTAEDPGHISARALAAAGLASDEGGALLGICGAGSSLHQPLEQTAQLSGLSQPPNLRSMLSLGSSISRSGSRLRSVTWADEGAGGGDRGAEAAAALPPAGGVASSSRPDPSTAEASPAGDVHRSPSPPEASARAALSAEGTVSSERAPLAAAADTVSGGGNDGSGGGDAWRSRPQWMLSR